MHGPFKFIKEPIPTYEQMQQLLQELDSDLMRSDLEVLYVQAIISWIYARLYLYLTPYTDPTMNKKIGTKSKPLDLKFLHAERMFIEKRFSLMELNITNLTKMKHLEHLADLKRTFCACEVHKSDWEINLNLLYQLKLPNTVENRQVIKQVLQSMPQGFSAVVSSCPQIIGTAGACELFHYEATPTNDGTFEAVMKSSIKQPYVTIKDAYIDFSGTSFVYLCTNKERKRSTPSPIFLLK